MAKDRRWQIEHCMEQVQAYRASGMKAKAWAQAHGVALSDLSSWCAHYRRWQVKREGGTSGEAGVAGTLGAANGFVAARVMTQGSLGPVASASASARIELHCGATRVELHWPLSGARELAVLLREIGR